MHRYNQSGTARRAGTAVAVLCAVAISTLGGETVLDGVGLLTKKSGPGGPAPAAPVLRSTPDNPTYATDATFTYTGTAAGFRCRLDNKPFDACPSGGISYTGLSAKSHTFEVQAVDSAGNASAPAGYTWDIVKRITFTVTGDAAGPLHPGVEQPVNLVIANPHPFAVEVTAVRVTVAEETSVAGCSGSQNLTVSVPFDGPVTVLGRATVTLSDSVEPTARPRLLMPDLATSQDACKNASFRLTYLATGRKK